MRWKLLRRRLSITAPRMIVRSHVPWPLRWAFSALILGFSAALALWAFEFGKDIAGLEQPAQQELNRLKQESNQLRQERDKAISIANTAESLLNTEKAAQKHLVQQLKKSEDENITLKSDLGFFERLLPAPSSSNLAIRALQVEVEAPGNLRFQLLLMQSGKSPTEFKGRYEITLTGSLEGKPWTYEVPKSNTPLNFKQYFRVEGNVSYPAQATVKTLQLKLVDGKGSMRATQTVKL
jgi:hypothetical protein